MILCFYLCDAFDVFKIYFAAKNKANSFITRARSGSTRFHVMSILNKKPTRLTEPETGQPASSNHPLRPKSDLLRIYSVWDPTYSRKKTKKEGIY